MAKSHPWISHVEAFVDTSRPNNEQNTSVDAIAGMVKNDLLTLEELVREMEFYLTTTDHVIRARGTLLLGEILSHLTSKPLGSATVSSLVGFFTSRLADWQALHGALVGCLALLRRKSNAGMVIGSEVKMLANAYLVDVRAQSLAVHDRMLCFEVLQCLLDVYPEAVMSLDHDLINGILYAIDEEKDPRCLMLTFRLAETLMLTYPDQSSLEESFVEESFEILSCYFPIYFTHQKNSDFDINRDDLSTALMNAFCSTPYFEPFVIPLLLDKLSSSLPLAKLDSLKYLSNCILKYGADRVLKHAKAIWSALKDVIFDLSTQGTTLTSTSESAGNMESHENQIAKEARTCLHTAISHLNWPESEPFINLILDDHDIERNFEAICFVRSYSGISKETQCQFSFLGSFLSIASKVSADCCSRVFQKYFPRLMNLLGVSMSNSSNGYITDCKTFSNVLNLGALYLCVELLASSRDLTMESHDISPQTQDIWWYLLKDFSGPLTFSLRSALANPGTAENAEPKHVACLVKGLQLLATFPGHLSLVSGEVYQDILVALMSVITVRSDATFLRRSALEALLQIGLHIENFHDSEKEIIYSKFVVERIVSLLSLEVDTPSLAFKLEALLEIGMTGPNFMSTVIRGLEEAIFINFRKVNGNPGLSEILVPLLKCYSIQVLPWCHKFGKADQAAMQFATNIWILKEKSCDLSVDLQRQGLLDTTMMAMKLAVGYCTEENQGALVQNAYNVLSSTTFPLNSFLLPRSNLEALQSAPDMSALSCKDEWLISLFASIVIALRPHAPLPDVGSLIRLLTVFLLKGHLPATQALASMINKWPVDTSRTKLSSDYKLEEAIDVVLESLLDALPSSPLKECTAVRSTNDRFSLPSTSYFQIHAVVGLSWIGKSLLLRGHERVKEIVMHLMKCLLFNQNMILDESEGGNGQDSNPLVTRAAADAFHILLCDSEVCLNKRFHATIKPLYKQRFFSSMVPVLLSSIKEHTSSSTRAGLYRALGHIFSDTPLTVLITEAKKVVPPLLESLSIVSLDVLSKEMTYSLLLVLSGVIMDRDGKEAIIENAHIIICHLLKLVSYPHMMLVRETAIQCLTAMSALPHTRIYPMRPQVLKALSVSLDDRKRVVREEAVRCRHAWT